MQVTNVQVCGNKRHGVSARPWLGLTIVKHAAQKAFQVNSALLVKTHFFNVEFAIVDHEREIRKQWLSCRILFSIVKSSTGSFMTSK
jgi:hypothetical protein